MLFYSYQVGEDRFYKEVESIDELYKIVEQCLEEYNQTHKTQMNLVIFRYRPYLLNGFQCCIVFCFFFFLGEGVKLMKEPWKTNIIVYYIFACFSTTFIEDITRCHKDKNVIFEWQNNTVFTTKKKNSYLRAVLLSSVRYNGVVISELMPLCPVICTISFGEILVSTSFWIRCFLVLWLTSLLSE